MACNAEIRCYSVLHLVECTASEVHSRLTNIGGSSRPTALPMRINQTIVKVEEEVKNNDGEDHEKDVEASARTRTRKTACTVPPSLSAEGSQSSRIVATRWSILEKLRAPAPSQDLVARDIADIPRVIKEVRVWRY